MFVCLTFFEFLTRSRFEMLAHLKIALQESWENEVSKCECVFWGGGEEEKKSLYVVSEDAFTFRVILMIDSVLLCLCVLRLCFCTLTFFFISRENKKSLAYLMFLFTRLQS